MPIATSTVKLWKNIVLSPDKNYIIEDLVNYLGAADTTISNFQFVELKKEMTIKIVLAQYNLQFDSTYNFNYCHISRSQGSSFSANDGAYYFVKAMRWKSTEAVELDLEMDVLNSFQWDSSYTISDKTLVKRQHKNRYSNVTSWSYMSDEFSLAANTPTTFRISTPLMENARIKSVSDITLYGTSITPIFVTSTVTSILPNTEYFFKISGSCPTPLSRLQALGNSIIFKRYDALGNLLENTKIGRIVINPDNNSLTVYKHTSGSSYETYKTVDWTDYPLNTGDSSGIWTFAPEVKASGYNVNTFCTGLGGTVVQSVDIQKAVHQNAVDITFTATNDLSELSFSFTYEVYAYMAYVDLKSEGINPPLYKTTETEIGEPSGVTWSLLYTNASTSDNSPVDCYLYPSTELQVIGSSQTNTIDKNNADPNNYMVFYNTYNDPNPTFIYNGNTLQASSWHSGGIDGRIAVGLKKDGDNIKIYKGRLIYNYNYIAPEGEWTFLGTYSSITVNTTLSQLKYYPVASLPTPSDSWNNQRWQPVYASGTCNMTGVTSYTVKSKDTIDRTDSKHIKLITLPYSPTHYSLNGSVLTIGSEWEFNTTAGTVKLINKNTKFENPISTQIPNLISEMVTNTYNVTLDGTGSRGAMDPKLYHSDYYYRKFVYDSFSKIFRCENLDWDESLRKNKNNPYFYFNFVTSRNIVSKFMFMFPQYTTGNHGLEDYDYVLPVARNNEEVLYNSQYLNYLRTGYNYDLKAKDRNATTGGLGVGLSTLALIGGIIATAVGAGTVGVPAIIGGVTGIAGSSISLAKTTAQAEENIQRKLQESQNQAVSVLNADDYDLLEAYCGNMAKVCTYEVSTTMRNALNDMFFYSGYVINEQYKPSVDVRYWFDFLQADLVINYTENLTKEIIELIKNKFSEGVTFFHCHTLSGTKTWDLEQEKENWEKWIVLANGGAA